MSGQRTELQTVKAALVEAGVEVYRTQGDEVHVAERIRFHIMDSGVRVHVAGPLLVTFVARSQRSDFPNLPPDALFEKVRQAAGKDALARGFSEARAATVDVNDPVDATKTLDVWHEVTYEKAVPTVEDAVAEVQWALALEKYVAH